VTLLDVIDKTLSPMVSFVETLAGTAFKTAIKYEVAIRLFHTYKKIQEVLQKMQYQIQISDLERLISKPRQEKCRLVKWFI
jgi:hypothetical protein